MIKYLLLFLLPLSLYASKILSYNIYERSDRADIMITFDTPFTGTIKQSKGKEKIIIKLNDASIESTKNKKINSNFLHSIAITPLKNQVQIFASISPNVKLIASKTSDAYGLRLRFTKKVKSKKNNSSQTDLSALPTKEESGLSMRYYLVVGFLIFGIILLLIVNKKVKKRQIVNKKSKDSWLFNTNSQEDLEEAPKKESTPNPLTQTSEVSIRFQKSINSTNSVVMLDFGEESYLVLMGNSNILLDKFKENKPSSEQEFQDILQERNKELEEFIGTYKKPEGNAQKESLQAYKERAALIYSDEEQ